MRWKLGGPWAHSQATRQGLEPVLTRSSLSGPLGHLPRVFTQWQGQPVEELVHKEKRPAQTLLIN